jgi:hypothetical protein
VPQVGLECRRAGDLGAQAGATIGDLAHVLDQRVDVLLPGGVDRDHREGDRPVLGDESLRRVGGERHDRGQDVLDRGHFLGLGADRLLVGLRQAAVAVVDGHRRRRLAAREALLDHLVGDDRVRVVGQEARDAVLGDLGELARQGAERQDEHPDAQDVPLGPPSARPRRDRPQHPDITQPLPRACAALR